MNRLKIKLSVLAVILGISGAFATMQHRGLDDQKWSRNPISGVYTNITGEQQGPDYHCTESTDVCTATYPEGQDPNSNPASPLSVETGLFH